MEWNTTREDPLTSYVKHFDRLIGDQRTPKTFGETQSSARWPVLKRAWRQKRGKQVRSKRQPVKVKLSACLLRVTYQTNVRRKGHGRQVTRQVWLVEVRVLGVDWEPWLLVSDWPVSDAQSAVRICTMYRERQECGGQFQMLENLPGLGRRAGARLASHSDVGRLGLGRRRLSL
jgi:hypothetical protein